MNSNVSWIKPLEGFHSNKTSIPLTGDVEVKISVDSTPYRGTGTASLELLGRPRILLSCEFADISQEVRAKIEQSGKQKADDISLSIEGCDSKDITLGPLFFSTNNNVLNIELRVESVLANIFGHAKTSMKRAIFHLFNFMEIKGAENGSDSIEILHLTCDKWKVTLTSLPDTSAIVNSLRTKGGYRLTHMGGIEKKDGSDFTGEELKECLTELRYALSFAKGGWCIPICPVGYDARGKIVWKAWSAPLEAWSGPYRWLDADDNTQLSTFFGSFMGKIDKDDNWGKILHEVIGWYLNANNSVYLSKEGGVVLTQAALEMLATEYLEIVDMNVNKDIQDGAGRATALLKKLFEESKVLDAIPDAKNLLEVGEDLPRVLVRIRNSIVHHTGEFEGPNKENIYEEAWKLGLWYLELSILHICGYWGTYKDRFTQKNAGVPWI